MKGIVKTFLCFLAIVLFSAFLTFAERAGAQEKPLTIAQGVDVSSFDPTSTSHAPVMNLYWNIYDSLTTWDEKEPTRLVPMLATSWKNINPTTVQFKLRTNVKFTNGEPFNAQTVKWNIEWMTAKGKHVVAGSFVSIDHADVVDEYTVNIVTKAPDPLLPKRFAAYGAQMTPPEYIKKVGREEFGQKPVGTGAYLLKEWVKDDHVTLTRNESYWGKKGSFKEVIFKPVPDNMTRLNMLLAGEADIVTSLLPDQVDQVKASRVARLEKVLGAFGIEYLFNCRKGPLKDKRVRLACHYAIDKEAILQKLWKGYGMVWSGALTTYDFGYNPDQKPFPYDPAKARQLIKEAGYEPGQITIDMMATGAWKELTEIICAYLNEAGINARPKVIEIGTRAQLLQDLRLWEEPGGGILVTPGSTLYDADGILWRVRHPQGIAGDAWEGSQPGKPWGFYEMMEKARYSFDQNERKKIYYEANKIYKEEALSLFLFQYDILCGVNNRIDFKPIESERIYLNRITVKK